MISCGCKRLKSARHMHHLRTGAVLLRTVSLQTAAGQANRTVQYPSPAIGTAIAIAVEPMMISPTVAKTVDLPTEMIGRGRPERGTKMRQGLLADDQINTTSKLLEGIDPTQGEITIVWIAGTICRALHQATHNANSLIRPADQPHLSEGRRELRGKPKQAGRGKLQ